MDVSFFDQSFLFLYLVLGEIGSAWSATIAHQSAEKAVEVEAPVS